MNTKENQFAGHNIKLPLELNCDVTDEKTELKREGVKINMENLMIDLIKKGLEFQKIMRDPNPLMAAGRMIEKHKKKQ